MIEEDIADLKYRLTLLCGRIGHDYQTRYRTGSPPYSVRCESCGDELLLWPDAGETIEERIEKENFENSVVVRENALYLQRKG